MRLPRLLLVAVVAAPLIAACGTSADSSGTSATAGFPVSIEHAQGTTTVPARPQRVVALGSADVQIAHALGANLVGAVRNDYSKDGQWPGVEPALGKDVELMSSTEPNLEKIASLRPDLILVTTAQPTFSQQYEKLSKIAPTISYENGILEDSGDVLVATIGKALGASRKAKALTDDSAAAIARWRKDHPDLDGQRIAFGQVASGSTYLVVSPTAPSTVFYRALGNPLSAELAKLPVQAPPGIAQVADEKLDLLDTVDHVILGIGSTAERTAFLRNPVVAGLDVTKKGRVHFVDFSTASAILAPSPATTTTILDELDRLLGDA